jgi:uncharacterized protein YyaL (SSP411 family)
VTLRRLLLIGLTMVLSKAHAAAPDRATLRSWGAATYNQIEQTLRVPGTALYAESAALDGSRNGAFGRAFVWSEATEFRLLDEMTLLNPATFTSKLRQFSDQLYSAYWNNGYQSSAGPGTRYYDDNSHVVVALMDAYRITHDPVYLSRAEQTQAFVMSGSDVSGGIRFQENTPNGNSDAISTLQGARGAAMIYRATGEKQYLNDATRLLTWANSHIQYANGLFYQRYNITTGPDDIPLINSAGIAISTNLELYQTTNNRAYLVQAEYIATRSLTQFFNHANGNITAAGYWAFELVDAFDQLRIVGGNPFWEEKMGKSMQWLHDNKTDPNGHYPTDWSESAQMGALPSWELNDQASVAVSYLETGAIGLTPLTTPVPEPVFAFFIVASATILIRKRR